MEHVIFNAPLMKIVKFVICVSSIAVHENACKRFDRFCCSISTVKSKQYGMLVCDFIITSILCHCTDIKLITLDIIYICYKRILTKNHTCSRIFGPKILLHLWHFFSEIRTAHLVLQNTLF